MSAIPVERLLTWTNRTRIGVAHQVNALLFCNITRCYGTHVAAFAVAVATGDIIKYQSFVYGSFVCEIHVRYNNNKCLKKDSRLRLNGSGFGNMGVFILLLTSSKWVIVLIGRAYMILNMQIEIINVDWNLRDQFYLILIYHTDPWDLRNNWLPVVCS